MTPGFDGGQEGGILGGDTARVKVWRLEKGKQDAGSR